MTRIVNNMTQDKIPNIVLVGRTNVGKSTLFNRLTESAKALVSSTAGTTRDRKEGICWWRGKAIKIVDTGGLDAAGGPIEEATKAQADLAMRQADLILFLVDVKTGPLPLDLDLAKKLTRSRQPTLVVGNKAESAADRGSVENAEWKMAGLPAPLPISALRGAGVGDLLDEIFKKLEAIGRPPMEIEPEKPVQVAVIGRPNVGKSSLLNAILGEERFITAPVAHTTREPNDVLITIGERQYLIVDTAGIRKIGKVRREGGLEKAGVERTKRIIKDTDVAVLVFDASQPIELQERTLAGMLKDENVGLIVAANKWDLVPDKTTRTMNDYKNYIAASLPFIAFAPVVFVSAVTQQRVPEIFKAVDLVQANRHRQVEPEELEKFWRAAVKRHLPSLGKGPKPPVILGMKQTGVAPPTFQLTIKAKRTDVLHPSYLRFLENRLREWFDFAGTPIVINVKTATAVANSK
jgi:GTP-binding protein